MQKSKTDIATYALHLAKHGGREDMYRKKHGMLQDAYTVPAGDGSAKQLGDSQFMDRFAMLPNTKLTPAQFQDVENVSATHAEQIGVQTRGHKEDLAFFNTLGSGTSGLW